MSHTPARLDTLDAARLTRVISTALDTPRRVELAAWTWQPVAGGLGGQGVYRVAGSALVDGVATTWSVVVKVLRGDGSDTDPAAETYWLREREVIQSGLLDGVEGGVSTPLCLAVEDVAADETWLWFEEVEDDIPYPWAPETWAEVARQFGRWQGKYVVGKPLPTHEWLYTGFLERCYTTWGPPRLCEHLPQPVLSQLYPDGSAATIDRFWDERDACLATYRRAPLAVAHLDANRANLFLREGRVVAIDWAFASIEPAGADLAGLIAGNLWSQEAPAGEYWEFADSVFGGYLAGLSDVGWDGDADAVRFVFLVAACLRHSTVFASTARWLATEPDEPFWGVMETILAADTREEAICQWGRASQFLAGCADEALSMV